MLKIEVVFALRLEPIFNVIRVVLCLSDNNKAGLHITDNKREEI